MNYGTTLVSHVQYYRWARVGERLVHHDLPVSRIFPLHTTTIRQAQQRFRRKGWRQTAGRIPEDNYYYWRFAKGNQSVIIYVKQETP